MIIFKGNSVKDVTIPFMGRRSTLTEDVTLKIKELVLDGKNNTEIQKILGISAKTWEHWITSDYQGIRVLLNDLKHELMIKSAEEFSRKLFSYDPEFDVKGKRLVNTRLLMIQQREAEFLRSTLLKGRDRYNKGGDVNIVVQLPTPILANVIDITPEKALEDKDDSNVAQ